jgi:hypothetical protein
MSTSSANPTAPMAIPTLAPVLRLLEEPVTAPVVLLVTNDEAVEVRADAAVRVFWKFVAIGTPGELETGPVSDADDCDPEVMELDAKLSRVPPG